MLHLTPDRIMIDTYSRTVVMQAKISHKIPSNGLMMMHPAEGGGGVGGGGGGGGGGLAC